MFFLCVNDKAAVLYFVEAKISFKIQWCFLSLRPAVVTQSIVLNSSKLHFVTMGYSNQTFVSVAFMLKCPFFFVLFYHGTTPSLISSHFLASVVCTSTRSVYTYSSFQYFWVALHPLWLMVDVKENGFSKYSWLGEMVCGAEVLRSSVCLHTIMFHYLFFVQIICSSAQLHNFFSA